MKAKTNLNPRELLLVSKGLNQMAKNQISEGKFVPHNEAERELLDQANDVLDEMLINLKSEMSYLFSKE